jgi:divalent metal cation (Fe/Co/Zn/Cd) transporter
MKCPFSKFRNIFGVPGKGVHAIKFKGTSLFDYFLTIVLAFIVTAITGWPLVLTTIGALILGIILHALFGVNTEAVKSLGLSC